MTEIIHASAQYTQQIGPDDYEVSPIVIDVHRCEPVGEVIARMRHRMGIHKTDITFHITTSNEIEKAPA